MTIANPVEADVKKKIKELLEKHLWFTWMPPANTYGISGQSDHLALKRGVFLAVEAKLKKATGTTAQNKFLADVIAAGGLGIVVNKAKLEKFAAFLQKLDEVYGWN